MAKVQTTIQPLAVRYERAAAMLDVSVATLRDWVAKGHVRAPSVLGDRIQLFDVECLREDWERLRSPVQRDPAPNPWDEVLAE